MRSAENRPCGTLEDAMSAVGTGLTHVLTELNEAATCYGW